MILTVDIGNTHIEMGVFDGGNLLKSWRVATGLERTEDEYLVFLQHFLMQERYTLSDVKGVAISSVVPNVTFVFEKLCQKYLQMDPLLVDHTLNLGITIRYEKPEEVGADRICNSVAGFNKFKQAVVVLDFGTATTFDVVNSRGEYLGGIIAPGIETTAWALAQKAAKLPKISLEFPASVIGRNTQQSMQVGIMYGTVAMIEGLIAHLRSELGEKPNVIATGGLTRLVQPRTKVIDLFAPHLVLEGLFQIYQLNRL